MEEYMAETLLLIPVRTSRQGTSLNAGKLKKEYQDETSTIEIHPDDMTRFGLKKGDTVRMLSDIGAEAVVSCKPQKGASASPGLIFMAYGPTSSRFMEADTAGTGMPISKQIEVTLEGPLAEDGSVIATAITNPAGLAGQTGAPLTPEQIGYFNALLSTGVSSTQAVWLSGYFAALAGTGLVSQDMSSGPGAASNLPRMTILFGTETGNGEGLANDLLDLATAKGFNACVEDMVEFDFSKLEQESLMFVLVSTHGEGDPPLAAKKLHSFLKSEEAPRLDQLKFAVFALGDSSYEFYCQTGKDFDAYLENLGATRVLDRVDADIDFEEPAEQWFQDVINVYQSVAKESGGSLPTEASAAVKTGKEKNLFSKTNPYHAAILDNYNLNGEGSAKENHHIEIELGDSGLSYEPGDALGVYPLNNPVYVDELLEVLKMDGSESVTVSKETTPLRDAFIHKLDITALSRVNMEKYANLIDSDDLKTLLGDDHKEEFNEYTWGREIIDLAQDFPAEGVSAQDFVNILRRIPGRLYSIASSIKAYSGQVHLLVGEVRYHSFDRDREGVCSTFLSGRMKEDEKLAIYVQSNKNFRLPEDPDTPVIMIGPGTGLAPFCSFLQERQATGAKGKNWLFFGDQHRATDFLYADKLEKFQEDGILTNLSLAFSRDQEQKIYVQTRILEQSKEIYEWLEEGANFYICGDASRMATDVHNALIETIVKEGGKSQEEAEKYVDAMLESKRYQRDVY